MKLTDEETDRALEFKWIVDMILFERERAVLYREVYSAQIGMGNAPAFADTIATQAINHMERAFEGDATTRLSGDDVREIRRKYFKESAHGNT